jgi:hypothetical protein
MSSITGRVARLERRWDDAGVGCPDAWHRTGPDPLRPRPVDYRHAAQPLMPPEMQAAPAPALDDEDRCPRCGAHRPTIAVVAYDLSTPVITDTPT